MILTVTNDSTTIMEGSSPTHSINLQDSRKFNDFKEMIIRVTEEAGLYIDDFADYAL